MSTLYIAYDNDEAGKSKSDWLRNKFTSEELEFIKLATEVKTLTKFWKLGEVRLLRRYFG